MFGCRLFISKVVRLWIFIQIWVLDDIALGVRHEDIAVVELYCLVSGLILRAERIEVVSVRNLSTTSCHRSVVGFGFCEEVIPVDVLRLWVGDIPYVLSVRNGAVAEGSVGILDDIALRVAEPLCAACC